MASYKNPKNPGDVPVYSMGLENDRIYMDNWQAYAEMLIEEYKVSALSSDPLGAPEAKAFKFSPAVPDEPVDLF